MTGLQPPGETDPIPHANGAETATRYMKARTLCECLDISLKTLERWERLGLPVVRVGAMGWRRYSLTAVEAWIRRQQGA